MDEHLLRFDKNKTYTYLDFETFNLGLTFLVNRPWQVGIIQVKGEKITNTMDILVDWYKLAPHLKIGIQAAMITRYSQEKMDRYGIQPDEAFEKFWPSLEECDHLVMHNGLRFDLYLIKHYAEMYGKPWKHLMPKIIDTMSVVKGIKLNIPYNPKKDNFLEYQYKMSDIRVRGLKSKLSVVAKENGIEVDENRLHDAIYDLTVNKLVWDALKHQVEI